MDWATAAPNRVPWSAAPPPGSFCPKASPVSCATWGASRSASQGNSLLQRVRWPVLPVQFPGDGAGRQMGGRWPLGWLRLVFCGCLPAGLRALLVSVSVSVTFLSA